MEISKINNKKNIIKSEKFLYDDQIRWIVVHNRRRDPGKNPLQLNSQHGVTMNVF